MQTLLFPAHCTTHGTCFCASWNEIRCNGPLHGLCCRSEGPGPSQPPTDPAIANHLSLNTARRLSGQSAAADPGSGEHPDCSSAGTSASSNPPTPGINPSLTQSFSVASIRRSLELAAQASAVMEAMPSGPGVDTSLPNITEGQQLDLSREDRTGSLERAGLRQFLRRSFEDDPPDPPHPNTGSADGGEGGGKSVHFADDPVVSHTQLHSCHVPAHLWTLLSTADMWRPGTASKGLLACRGACIRSGILPTSSPIWLMTALLLAEASRGKQQPWHSGKLTWHSEN